MAENGFENMAAFAMGMDSGKCANGGYGGGMGGMNDWMGLAMFALIFGRNGNGLFGGNENNGPCATQSDVRSAVDQQTLISKLDQQTHGISDLGYALNNTISNGFHGVDNAVCNLGFQTQSGFNALGAQLAACCCDIERGQDRISNQITSCCCDIGRQLERGFCDTNANIAAQTRSILDYLTNEKIDSLRAENQALRFSASQDRQNAYITTAMQAQTNQLIDRIAPYPVPSFNVCAPYQFGGFGAYGHGGFGGWNGWGRNNDCGCGCNSCC